MSTVAQTGLGPAISSLMEKGNEGILCGPRQSEWGWWDAEKNQADCEDCNSDLMGKKTRFVYVAISQDQILT